MRRIIHNYIYLYYIYCTVYAEILPDQVITHPPQYNLPCCYIRCVWFVGYIWEYHLFEIVMMTLLIFLESSRGSQEKQRIDPLMPTYRVGSTLFRSSVFMYLTFSFLSRFLQALRRTVSTQKSLSNANSQNREHPT